MKSLKKKSFKQRLCLAYSTLNTTKWKIENKRKTWTSTFSKKKKSLPSSNNWKASVMVDFRTDRLSTVYPYCIRSPAAHISNNTNRNSGLSSRPGVFQLCCSCGGI